MGTVEAVRFRHLLSQLTPSERAQFLRDLIANDPDLIVQAFHYLILEDEDVGINLNGKLSETIRAKSGNASSPSTATPSKAIESSPSASQAKDTALSQSTSSPSPSNELIPLRPFTKLPATVIGFLASFFAGKQFMEFSRTNREIYLGSHSPKKLVSIELDALCRSVIAPRRLERYTNTQTLLCDLTYIRHWDHPIFQLRMAEKPIFGSLRKVHMRTKAAVPSECDKFTEIVDCSDVHTLYLSAWDYLLLKRVLHSFPKLMYLTLCCTEIAALVQHPPILWQLNGMSMGYRYSAADSQQLIIKYGSQWDALSFFDEIDEIEWYLGRCNFVKLKELGVGELSTLDPIEQITSTAIYLKRVRFFFINHTIDSLEQVISTVIKRCKELESIEVIFREWSQDNPSSVDLEISAMDGIAGGLLETSEVHRDQFKVKMALTCMMEEEEKHPLHVVQRYIHKINCLMTALRSPHIAQWMFLLEVVHFDDFEDYDEERFVDHLVRVSPKLIAMHRIADNKVLFSNRECTINGPHDSWHLSIGYIKDSLSEMY